MDLTKMGMIQLQNPNHPTALLLKANQMRLAGTLCDVVIMVDNQEFHGHRTVLACTSKMFEILFHRSSQHYTLDFLSPKTFQQILEYAYTATLQAKVEDLDDLLYAAEILEIEYLEEQCLKILETIQASDENDTEVNMNEGGAEDDEDRKARYIKNMSKKHSMEEGGYANAAQQGLATATMVDQSPSVSTSFGLSTMSPTKAAVESLMSIGQSLLQSSFQQAQVKTEIMQVDEVSGQESPATSESTSSSGDKSGDSDKNKDGPGTPTRSSVITSARELHSVRDESVSDQQGEMGQVGLESLASLHEKHLASLYSLPPNHKTETLLSVPASMASALHMQPALAMSMDFTAYGGLLPQSFIQREFFNKLGELAAGMKPDHRSQHERCNVCGAELPDNDAVEQHRLTMRPPQSYSVGGQRSSGQFTGKPAGARPVYRGRWCAVNRGHPGRPKPTFHQAALGQFCSPPLGAPVHGRQWNSLDSNWRRPGYRAHPALHVERLCRMRHSGAPRVVILVK
ncbi:UNVERIFIED_CONTAM: hypothetical protein FKN15_016309 [Acipenser sinensis]